MPLVVVLLTLKNRYGKFQYLPISCFSNQQHKQEWFKIGLKTDHISLSFLEDLLNAEMTNSVASAKQTVYKKTIQTSNSMRVRVKLLQLGSGTVQCRL